MKKTKLFLLIAIASLLSSCSLNNPASSSSSSSSTNNGASSADSNTSSTSTTHSTTTSVEVVSGSATTHTQAAHTILVYMCGSNLESATTSEGGGLASANLQEMLSVSGIGTSGGVNVVIETGGAKSWHTTGISANKLGRYHIENGKLVADQSLSNASMGSSSTLQSFLEYGLTNFPADKTGLIFWDHGGAMDGVCFDENYSDDGLTNSEVKSAVTSAFSKQSRTANLEWIGYDACLMGMADVASFNSSHFNYMVSSQETEPGEGWDYDTWLKYLVNNTSVSTVSLLTKITDSYVNKCATNYIAYGGTSADNDATMAVLDLTKMSAFDSAFNTMASNLSSIVTSKSRFSAMFPESVQQFGYYDDTYKYCYGSHDAVDFLDGLSSSSTFSSCGASTTKTALNNVIVYHKYGTKSSDACGLSIFGATNEYINKSTYASSETNYTAWRSINISYGTWYSSY